MGKEIPTYALTDTGAEGKAFIDEEWARTQGMPLLPLKKPFDLEVIDGRTSEDAVTHYTRATCRINDHTQKEMMMFVTKLAYYPVVLGMPWLKQHDPTIRFASHTITFDSDYCRKHCNVPGRPSKLQALQDVPKTARSCRPLTCPDALKKYDLYQVSLKAAASYARKGGYRLFASSLEQIDDLPKTKSPALPATETSPPKTLPKELEEFSDVFSPKEAEKLPPHRPYDHHIQLVEGKPLPFQGHNSPTTAVAWQNLEDYFGGEDNAAGSRRAQFRPREGRDFQGVKKDQGLTEEGSEAHREEEGQHKCPKGELGAGW